MKKAIIKAQGLTKTYKLPAEDIVAVNNVDLEIMDGDFVSLMGPSGSGKTTLLDILGCLDSITSGNLNVLGVDVSGISERKLVGVRRGRMGFVFQEFLLVPELTALENVELPLTFAGLRADKKRAEQLLDQVGLEKRKKHLPRELSGGERQRVAIARALAVQPEILFADEPTGNLDSTNSKEIFSILQELNDSQGLTIVLTTHDDLLGKLAGRIVRLEDGRVA